MLKILRAFHLVNLTHFSRTIYLHFTTLPTETVFKKKKKFPRDLTLRKGYWQFGHPHLTLISLQPY